MAYTNERGFADDGLISPPPSTTLCAPATPQHGCTNSLVWHVASAPSYGRCGFINSKSGDPSCLIPETSACGDGVLQAWHGIALCRTVALPRMLCICLQYGENCDDGNTGRPSPPPRPPFHNFAR